MVTEQPGAVIKHYREQMKYIDPTDGKEKHWTQKDLATRLGLAEITITLMETQNKGLDSLERRRAIATLLKIPFELLGLASLEKITIKQTKVNDELIELYKDALDIYKDKFIDRSIRGSIRTIETWIDRIGESIQSANSIQKPNLLNILWDFHILAARTYGYDLCNWIKTHEQLNKAREIAEILDNANLRCTGLYYSGNFYVKQDKPLLAIVEFDASIAQAKKADPQIIGNIYGYASLAYATGARDLSSITYAQKLLEDSGKYIDGNGYQECVHLKHCAKALIALKRYSKALDFISDAEDKCEDDRLGEYLNILRAECYIEKKKPEYDIATSMLNSVVQSTKEQSHIDHIIRLHHKLEASSYGNAPDVADLGISLKK